MKIGDLHAALSEKGGYILLALMLVAASLVLSLSVALPRVRLEIRHDQELETVHRGQQYIRTVQLYYRKFHANPPSTDALVETNGMHFLRKKYIDPMTGKDDWQPIMLGQNKAPTAIGFFGQPLGLAGLTQAPGPSNSSAGSDAMVGSANGANAGSVDASNGSNSIAGTATPGQIYGGAGIIGFSPGSLKPSLLVYKTKNRYDEWESVYDPLTDWSIRGQLPMFPQPGPPTNSGSPGMNFGSSGANPAAGNPVSSAGSK